MTSKTIDCVAMVREIRDRMLQEMADKTVSEKITWINEAARAFETQAKKLTSKSRPKSA